MSFGETAARRALRENSYSASKAIARHLNEIPHLMRQAAFITGGQWDNISSATHTGAADKATQLLSAVEGKVDSGNDAEKGRQWLQEFVKILIDPDVNESDVAEKIAKAYINSADSKSKGYDFFSRIANRQGAATQPASTTYGGVGSNGASQESSHGVGKDEGADGSTANPGILGSKPELAQLLKFKYRDEDGDIEEMEVIPMVARRWRTFGVGGLGLKDYKVEACQRDNDIDSSYSVFQMFLQSGSKKFRDPKWSSVVQAMKDSEFAALATELEKALTRMVKNK